MTQSPYQIKQPQKLSAPMILQRDSDGYISLTALGKLAPHRNLASFVRLASVANFRKKLSQLSEIPDEDLIKTKAGKNGSTFAHPILAMKFVIWLDIEELEIWAMCTLLQDFKRLALNSDRLSTPDYLKEICE